LTSPVDFAAVVETAGAGETAVAAVVTGAIGDTALATSGVVALTVDELETALAEDV